MAYGRTFLQVVNDVLRAMREPEVATWDENTYSAMIGQFVNSVKRTAEDAHRWTALTDWHVVSTAIGTSGYSLTDTNDRAQVLEAWNSTRGYELRKLTVHGRAARDYALTAVPPGPVAYWSPYGLDQSTGEYRLRVSPEPDAIETLEFRVYAPQDDLVLGADVMVVPFAPVVEGAIARARNERGEDGGTSFADQALFMSKALADHIAIDANKSEDAVLWEAV